MDSEPNKPLHIFFFPFMAYGHMIPTVDLARLFAARRVKATIILTPLNTPSFSKTIDRDRSTGHDIHIEILQFPAIEAELPEGIENVDAIPSPEMIPNFFMAVMLLQEPFERLLEEHHPDFIIADSFLPLATDAACKFDIPLFVFHGTNFFSQCVEKSLECHKPYESITSDRENFVVPDLPDKIEMNRLQLAEHHKVKNEFNIKFMEKVKDAELRSHGVLVNSFYELEPAYVKHYRNVMGKTAWHIGPVSLQNRETIDKIQRGKKASVDEHYVLNWLDTKEPNSVLYICFGSMSRINKYQLLEIAMGLEDSGFSFVWVVRTLKNEEEERFLPVGFEERIEGKGLIIREWAPQVLILDHQAVGGFMTHCGWNSILEGVTAGIPMITWPLFAEQFHNENLVTEVLKVGIRVGAEEWNSWIETKDVPVKKEKIVIVATCLMGDGEEAEEMRKRAKELSDMAKRAVEDGGSSYADLTALIEELKTYKKPPAYIGD